MKEMACHIDRKGMKFVYIISSYSFVATNAPSAILSILAGLNGAYFMLINIARNNIYYIHSMLLPAYYIRFIL
jgi:hypothetical protein